MTDFEIEKYAIEIMCVTMIVATKKSRNYLQKKLLILLVNADYSLIITFGVLSLNLELIWCRLVCFLQFSPSL